MSPLRRNRQPYGRRLRGTYLRIVMSMLLRAKCTPTVQKSPTRGFIRLLPRHLIASRRSNLKFFDAESWNTGWMAFSDTPFTTKR